MIIMVLFWGGTEKDPTYTTQEGSDKDGTGGDKLHSDDEEIYGHEESSCTK